VSDGRWIEVERETASAVTHFSRARRISDDPALTAENIACNTGGLIGGVVRHE